METKQLSIKLEHINKFRVQYLKVKQKKKEKTFAEICDVMSHTIVCSFVYLMSYMIYVNTFIYSTLP